MSQPVLSVGRQRGPSMFTGSAPAIRFVLIGILISGCSVSTAAESSQSFTATPSPPAEQSMGGTQTSDTGEVTVTVTWAGPGAGLGFDVVLDTHSVDLDTLDLADAVLKNDRGDTKVARPWTAPSGGHHRQGSLEFDGDAPGFLADARWVELQIKGVGEIPERTFRWEVGS